MGTLRTFLVSAALCATATLFPGTRAHAQNIRAVGGFVGRTDSWQSWAEHPDTRHRKGIELGAFIDVATPHPWLSVVAEASYLQRGARLPVGIGGNGATLLGDVRVDYLSMAVLPQARVGLGPVSLFGYAGPGVDVHLDTQSAAAVSPPYHNDKAQVLVGEAGAGLELLVRGRWAVRAEIRRSADLTSAFTEAPGDIKFRSTEILIRFGIRPPSILP